MSIVPLPQYGQVEAAKNMHQSDCYRSASVASVWLGAHIKSIANVKIISPSSKISRQAGKQASRQAGKQASRQAGKQASRQNISRSGKHNRKCAHASPNK